MSKDPRAIPFQRAMPVLDVRDMARSVPFYRDRLGFAVHTLGEPPDFAICQRGLVTIALAKVPEPAVSLNWAAYIYVSDADEIYAELAALSIQIAEPPADRPYECRDFVVNDPDGHVLAIGHVIDPDPLGPGLSEDGGRDGSMP